MSSLRLGIIPSDMLDQLLHVRDETPVEMSLKGNSVVFERRIGTVYLTINKTINVAVLNTFTALLMMDELQFTAPSADIEDVLINGRQVDETETLEALLNIPHSNPSDNPCFKRDLLASRIRQLPPNKTLKREIAGGASITIEKTERRDFRLKTDMGLSLRFINNSLSREKAAAFICATNEQAEEELRDLIIKYVPECWFTPKSGKEEQIRFSEEDVGTIARCILRQENLQIVMLTGHYNEKT